MQVGCQFGAELFGEFGIEGTLPGKTFHQFTGNVFAVGAASAVAAEQQFVSRLKTGEQYFVCRIDFVGAALQFGVTIHHGID